MTKSGFGVMVVRSSFARIKSVVSKLVRCVAVQSKSIKG